MLERWYKKAINYYYQFKHSKKYCYLILKNIQTVKRNSHILSQQHKYSNFCSIQHNLYTGSRTRYKFNILQGRQASYNLLFCLLRCILTAEVYPEMAIAQVIFLCIYILLLILNKFLFCSSSRWFRVIFASDIIKTV